MHKNQLKFTKERLFMAKFKLHELIDGYETSSGGDFVGRRFFMTNGK